MKSAWHDDSEVIYGFFNGAATQLCEILVGDPAAPDNITMHRPSNMWIKINGEQAISESYVVVYTMTGPMQSLIGGRYLDRHERRDGQWRLSHRTYVFDWNINQPATGSGLPGFDACADFRHGPLQKSRSGDRSHRHWVSRLCGLLWRSPDRDC